MRLLLVGNYGVGNLGDEALRQYFLRRFPEVDWAVMSARPRVDSEVPRLPFGIRSFLSFSWIRTLYVLRRVDGVVFGGGSLFTDAESVRACLLWWWHVWMARRLGKPVFLAFQGIGPFRTRLGAWCARKALQAASFVSVRDAASCARALDLAPHQKIVQSFDPVFSSLQAQRGSAGSKKVLIAIPRINSDASFAAAARQLMQRDRFDEVHVLSLQPGNAMERGYCQGFCSLFGPHCSIRSIVTVDDLWNAMAEGSFVLSARYHGALAAIALGIPVRLHPQREGDKLAALEALVPAGTAPPSMLQDWSRLVLEGERGLRAAWESL